MGFFNTKSSFESTTTHDNPELRQYTQAYRNASPWGFATLDPTATLAAMTKSPEGTLSEKFGGVGGEFGKELKKQAQSEEMEREASNEALQRIRQRQESGEFLTPKETEFINTSLDKAFEYAHKTGFEDWTKATQTLAGSRGMRLSDSPVADPAMRELRNFEVGLGSERAKMGLDATLQFSHNQQMFDQNFTQMLKTLGQNRWSTRQGFLFGGGMQAASQLGFTDKFKGTQTQGMSGLGKVMGTMGMVSGGLDLVGKIGTMGSGFATGGVGGMSSGLASFNKPA